MKYGSLQLLVPVGLLSMPVQAQSQASAPDNTFTLGQITVTAPRIQEGTLIDPTVDSEELWRFDVKTLDEAVKLVPGVMATFDTNGRRNEHDIFVRGFGRWHVPLSIDGIRIYLPADNRLDFNRFLTHDLAQIQIQKGYASVIDGPGAMGGAINLVTRKPSQAFEAEFQSSASFDNGGSYEGWNGSATLGTRQERYYLQASGSYLDREHWSLSRDFAPIGIEDGGERDRSDNRDWRVNAKIGFTPNETDEYSVSYVSQSGSKGAPLNVNNNPPNPLNSYWDWPWWDIENLYWLSNTQLGASAYLKTRLFYNTFDNALYSYDDGTYTTQSLGSPNRSRSLYDDTGYGGSVEIGSALGAQHALRAAIHYRRDQHEEFSYLRPTHPTLSSVEPVQHTRENTWSAALEDTFRPVEAVDVVVGVSYDKNELRLAQEFNAANGLFAYPTGGSDAFNSQGAVHWRYADNAELRASISSRTRFPTLFERFSTRFDTAVPNPDLGAERAINYEIGWQGELPADTQLSAALFYNDVKDVIQTVVVSPGLTQTQNIGDGEYYGVELAADSQLNERLRFGANYTYLKRKIVDPLQPNFRTIGTPTNQAFVFVTYRPIESLTITPSLELADDRWSDVTGGGYVKVGDYTLANLQLQYRHESFEFALGGRNLLDENYQLAWGFPEPGRTWFAKLRFSY